MISLCHKFTRDCSHYVSFTFFWIYIRCRCNRDHNVFGTKFDDMGSSFAKSSRVRKRIRSRN